MCSRSSSFFFFTYILMVIWWKISFATGLKTNERAQPTKKMSLDNFSQMLCGVEVGHTNICIYHTLFLLLRNNQKQKNANFILMTIEPKKNIWISRQNSYDMNQLKINKLTTFGSVNFWTTFQRNRQKECNGLQQMLPHVVKIKKQTQRQKHIYSLCVHRPQHVG